MAAISSSTRPPTRSPARVREFMEMPKESIPGEEIMATPTTSARPPFPPFTRDSAMQKVRLELDAWDKRDEAQVALAYAIESRWRNRFASINDLPILASDRKYHWPLGRRPDEHSGLSDLGL